MCKRLYIFLIFLSAINVIYAKELILTDTQNSYQLDDYDFEICTDLKENTTLSEIISRKSDFHRSKYNHLNFGMTSTNYWVHFSVKNNASSTKKWVLSIEYPLLDYLEVNQVTPDTIIQNVFSDLLPFEARQNADRLFSTELKVASNTTTDIYLKVNTKGSLQIPVFIYENDTHCESKSNQEMLYGIFYGIMLIMILYNLIVYMFTKSLSYLFYVLTITSALVFFGTINGHVFKYFLPDYPVFVNYLSPISLHFWGVGSLMFTYSFLNLKKHWANSKFYLDTTLTVYAISLVVTLFGDYLLALKIISTVLLITMILLSITGTVAFIRGNKAARFFLIAWSSYIAGSMIFILMNYGVIPQNTLTTNAPKIGGILEVILLALALVDRYRLMKRENEEVKDRIIKIQENNNKELEQKVVERTLEVTEQKEKLSIINKNLMDSIRYAQKIQHSVLPDVKKIHKTFVDSFIYYKPKDIVSGDFYWYHRVGSQIFIAAADCTGHGVPAALLSVIGNASLNSIVIENRIFDPSEILSKLHSKIQSALNQEDEIDAAADGMDIAICVIDTEEKSISYAGAMRPVYLINEGDLIELRPTRMPIGGTTLYKNRHFETQKMQFLKNDMLYLFSDGYYDQFGGDDSKKFMVKRFKEMLLTASKLSCEAQKKLLEQTFTEWRGENDQIDDILIMGIRL